MSLEFDDDDDDCFGCQELWDAHKRIEELEWLIECERIAQHPHTTAMTNHYIGWSEFIKIWHAAKFAVGM